MNSRLSLAEFAARLTTLLPSALGVVKIGTALDHDYLQAFADPTKWPAVWIAGQRATAKSTVRRTGLVRVESRVEVAIRVMVARGAAGVLSRESTLTDIAEAVQEHLSGWRPTGGDIALTWERTQDGPPEKAVLTADLIFTTQTTHQHTAA